MFVTLRDQVSLVCPPQANKSPDADAAADYLLQNLKDGHTIKAKEYKETEVPDDRQGIRRLSWTSS